jgi:hypothetical protein
MFKRLRRAYRRLHEKIRAHRHYPLRIRVPSIRTESREGFEIRYTAQGKNVIKENPELFPLFRHFQKMPFESLTSTPDGMGVFADQHATKPLAIIRLLTGRKRMAKKQYDTRYALFTVTLPEKGRVFTVKIGRKATEKDGHEIETAYLARAAGVRTVKHLAQFEVRKPASDAYFLLMEHAPYRLLSDFFPDEVGYARAMEHFNEESALLAAAGIEDAEQHNCFVQVKSRGRIRLRWFDLRLSDHTGFRKRE